MTNKVKGEVSFSVGDREYTLNYSHGALVKLEKKLDMGIVKIIRTVQSWQTDPEEVRLEWAVLIFWAGLQKHHPDLTVEQAGDLMAEIGGLPTAMAALNEGLASAFGAPDEGVRSTPNPTREAAQEKTNGTGTVSISTISAQDTSLVGFGRSLPENTGY